ncbi:MAG TPA: phage antirepressor KilAC domain-containing protein [Patescibacteria group bacterium]|nr:phage antirepressor KilAC domain-containing protein [Patescibacteria group bacterium]
MSSLIQINNDSERQTTSARSLWEFLDKPYDKFTKWFDKFKEYGFGENEDFREVCTKIHTSNGAEHDAVDYEITIDMAKELSMLQRSEKGKQARQYFIELEKQWNTPEAIFARALKMANNKLLEMKNVVINLETKIEEQKPLVLFAETCIASNDSLLVREVAKLASKKGINIGEKRLWKKLREWEVVNGHNEPYQRAFDAGWFETRQGSYSTPYGTETYRTYKVTPKGQIYIIERLRKEMEYISA